MKFLRQLWRILCCIVYALSLPPRWFGYGLRWCFGWVKYPWRRLPAGFRTAVASVYASLPVRLLRWVVFVVACLLFWVLFLVIVVLVLALFGVLGPIILRLAPPIARSVGYELAIRECVVKPLDDDIHVAGLRLDTLGSPRVGSDSPLVSLEAFRVAPLSGYVRLDALRVANPDTFIFSQASGDYYAKTPLLDLRLVELKVDMGTLLADELVIELIRVHGLHALYALDQGTDNVSALVAQLVPPAAEEPDGDAAPVQAEPAPAPAPAPEPAPAEATAKADAPERDVRVLLADFADNAVTVRWVIAGAVPTTVPCPIPDLALENLGTQEVRDRIDAVVGPIRKTIATANAAVAAAGKALGAAIDSTKAALGAAGEALGNAGDALDGAGDALGKGVDSVSEAAGGILDGARDLFNRRKK